MSPFSDEIMAKWEYALQNVWTIKFDRQEVEALLRRLRASEKGYLLAWGAHCSKDITKEMRQANEEWLKAAGK